MLRLHEQTQQLFNMHRLADALGYDRPRTWYLVHATLEAIGIGGGAPAYLIPAAYIFYEKGGRYELLFTQAQLDAAAQVRCAREAAAGHSTGW